MKKLACLGILVLCLTMLIPGLAEEVAGDWYLNAIQMGGETNSPSVYNMSMTLSLNPDGTAVMTSVYGDEPETSNGQWQLQNNAVIFSTPTSQDALTFTGDSLVLSEADESLVMIFTREEPAGLGIPQAIAASAESDFFGDFALTFMSIEGSYFPAREYGFSMFLRVSGGQAVLSTEDENITMRTAFEDGMLRVTDEDGTYSLQKNEDGSLSLAMPFEDVEEALLVFYPM